MEKRRNTNIELLRIVSMLFIVMGHFSRQSGFEPKSKDFLYYFLSSGFRISVNIFLLIAVWFMVDADFSVGKRVVKTYSELFFYSIGITLLVVFLRGGSSIMLIIKGLVPFSLRSLWFASAYITLLFFSPFLRKIFELEKRIQTILFFMSFLFVCIGATVPSNYTEGYIPDCIWFLFVYYWIGYVKHAYMEKYRIDSKAKSFGLICCGGIIYVLLVVFRYQSEIPVGVWGKAFFVNMQKVYLNDIKTLPNFGCALFIFLGVVSLPWYSCSIINNIAKNTFSVYLFHQVPAFILIWCKIVLNLLENLSITNSIALLLVGIGTFFVASLVESLRMIVIEPKLEKMKIINSIASKIDSIYVGL